MEIAPEAIVLAGAGITGFVVAGLRQALASCNDRYAVVAAMAVGVAIAVLLYAAGFVDVAGLTTLQAGSRAVLAGLAMAAAASGGRSWSQQLRPK